VVRVGGLDPIPIDVRLIAATNRNLTEAIAAGAFREDLYYRLSTFPIDLPPLRERGDDVLEIAEHLLAMLRTGSGSMPRDVREMLRRYDWPGNVRELRNVLERALILAGGEELSLEDFNLEVETQPVAPPGGDSLSAEGLEEREREMILRALEQAGGNKTEAAKLLKITRRRLYSRMRVHGIDV
jgi:DNA-binding NtrC family response regulator